MYVAEFGAPSSIAMIEVQSAGGKCALKELPNSPVADPNSSGLLSIGVFPCPDRSNIARLDSRTIRRGGSAGKSSFNPRNLVPHGVPEHAAGVEIGIPFPLNPVALFTHAGDDGSG